MKNGMKIRCKANEFFLSAIHKKACLDKKVPFLRQKVSFLSKGSFYLCYRNQK